MPGTVFLMLLERKVAKAQAFIESGAGASKNWRRSRQFLRVVGKCFELIILKPGPNHLLTDIHNRLERCMFCSGDCV